MAQLEKFVWNLKCSIAGNVLRLGGRFNAAKPLLYEVPTYLAEMLIEAINRKTKRKKGWKIKK